MIDTTPNELGNAVANVLRLWRRECNNENNERTTTKFMKTTETNSQLETHEQ